jgi:predicted dehydrogenase
MINVAVVGCGYWGPNLIRNFHSLPDCCVKVICDFDRQRLDYLKKSYPAVTTTTDYTDVIGNPEVNAVAIATPVQTHFPLAVQSLKAGKHTFIEKPMAVSADQCRQLIDLAADRSLTLMVGHTFIYSSPVRKIKEIIASGELGEVLYISSRRLNLGLFQNDINVAWDLAPHDVSIILCVLDHEPVSVNCQGKAHLRPGIEDVTNMTINFANGGIALIHSSWIDPRKVRETTIVGSKKMIVYDDNEPLEKLKIYDQRVEVPPHYDTYAEFHFAYHYGDMYSPYLKQVEPLKVECQQLLDCIQTGVTSDSSGKEGLKVVQILEAATRSLRNGGSEKKIGEV